MKAREVITAALRDQYICALSNPTLTTADIILTALDAAGLAIVPKVPTKEMIAQAWIERAIMENPLPGRVAWRLWAAMLSAAQEGAND